jgi:hypothetical protein
MSRPWGSLAVPSAASLEMGRAQGSALDHHTKGRRAMDWNIELVATPVSDVDRAKAFYTEKAGFNADHDHRVSEEVRFVQLTPPGSACSIAIGTGISQSQPGSLQGMQMVVSDINAARGAPRAGG